LSPTYRRSSRSISPVDGFIDGPVRPPLTELVLARSLRPPVCQNCPTMRRSSAKAKPFTPAWPSRVAPLLGQADLVTIWSRPRSKRSQSVVIARRPEPSRKAHQYCLISLLRSPSQYCDVRLLTGGLQVRVLPEEPTFLTSIASAHQLWQ